MRKIAAILLLLILAFNFGGYRLIISLLEKRADVKLEAQIDNIEYSETQLIEIRVPLNMPYQERYTDFERHYGEINIEGKLYTYVKRKIEGNVLVLKCIANESKQQLKQTANELAKSNTGQDQDNSGKKQSNTLKSVSTDFDDKNHFCSLTLNDIIHRKISGFYSAPLKDVLIKTPDQPPRNSSFIFS